MPRGFTLALYVDDRGNAFKLSVDADSALDPNRGWGSVADPATPFAPRGFLPRRVVGIDETGIQQEARVGTNDCALWTGGATTFDVEGTDGITHVATVVVYQAEKQIGPGSGEQT